VNINELFVSVAEAAAAKLPPLQNTSALAEVGFFPFVAVLPPKYIFIAWE